MTEKQAIWKSILHWRRMIKWVKGQPPRLPPNRLLMEDEIREAPGVSDCALCVLYWMGNCRDCPLSVAYGGCGEADTENAYHKAIYSKTKRGWLKHARRLLKQLESLRGKK